MFSLNESEVTRFYDSNVIKAKKFNKKKRYDDCLRYLKVAAYSCYYFNIGFKDDDLEDILESVSKQIFKEKDLLNRKQSKCVFYDSFSIDNGGLVQQYLGALMSLDYEICYISEKNITQRNDSAIGLMLLEYGKANIVTVPPKLKPFEKAQFIYDKIIQNDAGRLFIHSSPDAVSACCAFYALPKSVTKYKINLTDHTFWIGTRFIDYSFEFRPYGCFISTTQRGITADRVFHVPFYPILNHKKFQGFPKESDGKTILFSGASYYKIFDDYETFFKLVQAILNACPDVVLLFAGSGDKKVLNGLLEKYKLKGRFIPIGQRSDITEVFEHCDIYLNTYPIGGGLMTQYAAQLGKPIVNYHTPNTTLVEEFVCQTKRMTISDNSVEAVVRRVKRLVENPSYRSEYGEEIRSGVVSPQKFNLFVSHCLSFHTNPLSFTENVSFECPRTNMKDKLAFENNTKDFQRNVVKVIGLPSLWQCPLFLINSIFALLKSNRLFATVGNRFKNDKV